MVNMNTPVQLLISPVIFYCQTKWAKTVNLMKNNDQGIIELGFFDMDILHQQYIGTTEEKQSCIGYSNEFDFDIKGSPIINLKQPELSQSDKKQETSSLFWIQ